MGQHVDEIILKQQADRRKATEQKTDSKEDGTLTAEELERELNQSIYDGTIEIDKVPVEFAERLVMNERIAMYMPTEFEPLEKEDIKLIYPFGDQPQHVYGSRSIPFMIGFRETHHKIPKLHLNDFAKLAKTAYESMTPSSQVYRRKSWETGGHSFASLELVTKTLNKAMYSLMIYTFLEDEILMGFLNCSYPLINRYRPLLEEIAGSVRFVEEKQE